MKINAKDLYVACHVYDVEYEIEPWVQYDSLGKIDHTIIVDPKRVLLVKQEVDGKEVYLECKTMQPVIVTDYESSFVSRSSCCQSLYLSGLPLGPLYDDAKRYFQAKYREVQFIIPFSEYCEQRLGYCPEQVSLTRAKATVSVLNATEGKEFKLSHDEEEANKQIERRIYKNKSGKTRVKRG